MNGGCKYCLESMNGLFLPVLGAPVAFLESADAMPHSHWGVLCCLPPREKATGASHGQVLPIAICFRNLKVNLDSSIVLQRPPVSQLATGAGKPITSSVTLGPQGLPGMHPRKRSCISYPG